MPIPLSAVSHDDWFQERSLLRRQPYDEPVTAPARPATPSEPTRPDRRKLPSRKVVPLSIGGLAAPDAIEAWASRYLDAAVRRVRSAEVADKIALYLARFRDHFHATHGHDRLSAVIQREVIA